MKTNNAGLVALTTDDELREVQMVGKRRKIKFAYWQSDFKGGKIPFWHVNYLNPNDFGTTLSMDGLKQWGVI